MCHFWHIDLLFYFENWHNVALGQRLCFFGIAIHSTPREIFVCDQTSNKSGTMLAKGISSPSAHDIKIPSQVSTVLCIFPYIKHSMRHAIKPTNNALLIQYNILFIPLQSGILSAYLPANDSAINRFHALVLSLSVSLCSFFLYRSLLFLICSSAAAVCMWFCCCWCCCLFLFASNFKWNFIKQKPANCRYRKVQLQSQPYTKWMNDSIQHNTQHNGREGKYNNSKKICMIGCVLLTEFNIY